MPNSNHSNFTIEPATAQHAVAMLKLIQELAVFEKEPEAVIVTPEKMAEYGWGPTPLFIAWIAKVQDNIVGLALCYTRYSTWKGPVLYLEDLIVSEPYRKLGIGKALFETSLNYAKEKKFTRMVWQVLDWNLSAINFYTKYGASFDPSWVNGSIEL